MQQEYIIVVKAAAFVSFRGSLFQRGTYLWRTVLIDFTKMCYNPCLEYALACYSKPQEKVVKAVS